MSKIQSSLLYLSVFMLGFMMGMGLTLLLECDTRLDRQYKTCMTLCTATNSFASFVDAKGGCMCKNGIYYLNLVGEEK